MGGTPSQMGGNVQSDTALDGILVCLRLYSCAMFAQRSAEHDHARCHIITQDSIEYTQTSHGHT